MVANGREHSLELFFALPQCVFRLFAFGDIQRKTDDANAFAVFIKKGNFTGENPPGAAIGLPRLFGIEHGLAAVYDGEVILVILVGYFRGIKVIAALSLKFFLGGFPDIDKTLVDPQHPVFFIFDKNWYG